MSDRTSSTGRSPPGPTLVRTFLIADVRGYTRFTRERGDEAAADLATRFAEVGQACVAEWAGELVDIRGDELAAAFGSSRQALQAAVDLQHRFAAEVRANPSLPLLVGIGMDAGESVAVEDGYRGAALNLAARLCSLARPGEVLVSDTVEHLAGLQPGIAFKDRGLRRVKGLERPVHVFQATFPLDLPRAPTTAGRWTRARVGGIAAAVVIIVAAAAASTRGGPDAPAAVAIRADSLVEIDVKARRIIADVPLHTPPTAVVSGGGRVWVAAQQRLTVVRVDPETLKSTPVAVGFAPQRLAYGEGSLWAYYPAGPRAARIDPNLALYPDPTAIHLPACPRISDGCQNGGGIAEGGGSVWISRATPRDRKDIGVVWQLNPHTPTPEITRTIHDVPVSELAYGGGAIWTGGGDPKTSGSAVAAGIEVNAGQPIGEWPVPGGLSLAWSPSPLAMTYAYDHAWLISGLGSLPQLNDGGFGSSVPLAAGTQDVAGGGGYLWATNGDGTLTQCDPFTLTSVKTYQLHRPAYGVAYTKGRVWVSVA